MLSYTKRCLGTLLLGATALGLYAVPAKRGTYTVTQPDGTELAVQMQGDEFSHLLTTPDGYPLVEHNNTYQYATVSATGEIMPSGIAAAPQGHRSAEALRFLSTVDRSALPSIMAAKAQNSPLRRAEQAPLSRTNIDKGLFPGANFPVLGSPHILVILVEYSDVSFTVPDPADYFTRMMTEPGFNSYGGTGSALEYFTENSLGAFTPQIDVLGPVKLPETRKYYGGNSAGGDDRYPYYMVIHACDILDAEVDFTKYDTDGDGTIDNVFVFYAGTGEASGGPADSVWPHSYEIKSSLGISRRYDGVYVDRYACANEWQSGRPDGIGTFVHEFSHVMGLPDLYCTSGSSTPFTPGEWSVLDYGPYNNNSRTPPNYSAFERYALGWTEPIEINKPIDARLEPISSNICGIIRTNKANEFFLFENRQQQGWDKYIPGHGMLVWHIDYNATTWNGNKVNNTSSHQYVDIEEADNIKSYQTQAGDAFPGTSNVTSFTDNTSPNMKSWGGLGQNLPITDIAEQNGIITFKVAGGGSSTTIEAPVLQSISGITPSSFTLNWKKESDFDYAVLVLDQAGKPVEGYNKRRIGSTDTYTVTGLTPLTEYSVSIFASQGFYTSPASNTLAATTLKPTVDYFTPRALEPSDAHSTGFTAHWEPLEEATAYELTVSSFEKGEPHTFTTGFDESKIPTGWETKISGSASSKGRYGAAAPAVSMKAIGQYVRTCQYEGGVSELTFWSKGYAVYSDGEAKLNLTALIDGEWTTFGQIDASIADEGATTTHAVPAGALAVGVELAALSSTSSAKMVVVDDFEIKYGNQITRIALPGYNALNVGNVTSYAVTGLDESKTYSYTVHGINGALKSKESNEVVVGMANSGISGVENSPAALVSLSGRALTVETADSTLATAVFDIAGRTVATIMGSGIAKLPCAGIYIVKSGATATKIAVK